MQPLVLCAYEVDVAPVFDALDGADKASLGIVDADLDCPAWRLEALSGRRTVDCDKWMMEDLAKR